MDTPEEDGKTLFRMIATYSGDHVYLHMSTYEIKRETAKCYVIDEFGRDKFVLKEAKRRYAYPTIAEAKLSFLKRKDRQIEILERQLRQAKFARIAIQNDLRIDKGPPPRPWLLIFLLISMNIIQYSHG